MIPGECFKTAFDEFAYGERTTELEKILGQKAKLIHGYPRLLKGPHTGDKFIHAWIEVGIFVIDGDYTFDKEAYYKKGQINPEENTEYGREIIALTIKKRHYGPFKKIPKGVRYRNEKGHSTAAR